MKDKHKSGLLNAKIDRRDFLKASAVLGSAVGAVSMFKEASVADAAQTAPIYSTPGPNPVDTDPNVKIIRSVCLMCHSGCGIRGLVDGNGRLVKIDGNPYHPNTRDPHLPYDTDSSTVERSRICAKGQAGIEQVYTPIRIKHPLKRVGPRGSGEWEVITWDTAFTEIIEGGNLFGEGNVEGLRELRDLETPLDPDAPELGPKANQVVFCVGRHEHGRKEFTDAFWKYSYGTINYRNDHTSICELSHHIAHEVMFGGKHHLKPDILNCKYQIWWGASPLEAGFPMIALARKLMQFKKDGGKLVVIDPRFSNTAAKADTWVPVKPGTDAALALGMIRWIIDNNDYDASFLRNTTKEAANNNGETTWTNSTYLVRLDDDGDTKFRTLLRADEAGLGGTTDDFVVAVDGEPTIHSDVEQGDLEAELTVNGIPCKSVFTLLKERVQEKTIAEYAQICDVDADVITQIASEFAANGKQAVSTVYRGPVQHTNGSYTAMAILSLNLLVGNINWKGGYVVGGSHWHEDGSKSSNLYNLKNWPSTDDARRVSAGGAIISRDSKGKIKYEDTTEFANNGYPAKRPWFPLSWMIWQEVFAGIAEGYPYPIKALILNMGNPAYSTPAGRQIEDTLKDTSKVPLYVSIDRVMSEAASVADYILPDVSYLERYETPHVAPAILTKASGFRQPMFQEPDPNHMLPKAKPVFPDTMDTMDMIIEIGKRLELAGIGPDALGPGKPLNEARDWYAAMAANIAVEDGGVPGSAEAEKIDYILARGGRFEDADKAYDGDFVSHKYTSRCDIYVEKWAKTKNVMTGEPFDGLMKYEPIMDAKGNDIEAQDAAEYPFQLITHKLTFHTQSRTAENRYLMSLLPQNYVEINSADAEKLGIQTGDKVRVTSSSNAEGVVGFAKVSNGVRIGVVNIPHSYGHWQYGSKTWKAGDDSLPGDDFPEGEWDNEKYGRGVLSNVVMRLDDSVGSVGLQDLIGGSASFYDTWVKVEKA